MADRNRDVARDAPTQVSIPPTPRSPELARGSARPTDLGAPGDAGPCVDTDELAAMIAGELDAERVEAVLIHVDRCELCAEVMANLGRLDEVDGGKAASAGRYQLGRVLGAGGMGIVYDAWDPQLRRRVALKLVRPEQDDAASQERMWREARALARVSHPNVVAVYDVTEHAGQICVATELVDGETLATWQHDKSTKQIAEAWLQAARGIAAAHAGGIVHRDVKPANVFVGRDGRVRVGDFGLARLGSDVALGASGAALPAISDQRVTATGFAAGTPAYMAPEQLRGEVDARSDQFALCVALGEALTGTRPVANDAPQLPGEPAISAVLARGLREEPAERWASMDALADALAAALTPALPPRRAGWIAAAGLAVIAGATAWLMRPGDACAPPKLPDGLWSSARRTQLASVLPSDVAPKVDAWLGRWSAQATDVCVADRGDAATRVRRARCLYDQLLPLQVLTERWALGEARSAMSSEIAVEELPRASRCSHAALPAGDALTVPQAIQQVGLGLRVQLAGARPEPEALRAIASDAAQAGDVPFAVAVAIARADREHDPVRATAVLREAIATADAAHAELAGAMARVALIARLGADPADEATALGDAARRAITAAGGDPALEADLDYNLGGVLTSRSQHERAIALFEHAQRLARVAYGPSSLHEGGILIGLAGAHAALDPNGKPVQDARDAATAIFRRAQITVPALDELGQLGKDPKVLIGKLTAAVELLQATEPGSGKLADAEYALGGAYVIGERDDLAIIHYQRAVAIQDQLGVNSAAHVAALSQIAAMLREAGRPGEAVATARRAVKLAEDINDDLELGAALNNLGAALLELGPPSATDEARGVLERALVIRERTHEPAQFRGRTRFLLATALYVRDPGRAKDLAHAARVDLKSFVDSLDDKDPSKAFLRKEQDRRLADIDRWLAQHR